MAKKEAGYQISDEDIEVALRYLRTNKNPNATREDAINFLEGAQTTIHLASHSKEGLEALKGLQKKLKKKAS